MIPQFHVELPMSLPEMDPLPLAPLPLSQGRAAGAAGRDLAAQGFVDEEAVARMLADPPITRARPTADDWAFSPRDEDFVAWRRELAGGITRPLSQPRPAVCPEDSPFQRLAAAEESVEAVELVIPSLSQVLETRPASARAPRPGQLWLALGSALLTAAVLALFLFLFEQERPPAVPGAPVEAPGVPHAPAPNR
jgi:FAD/FMN-containing dehydrogenase